MSDYAPSIKAARLFEKVSKNGNMYLVGRMGALRVTLLKSKDETGDGGEPVWHLMLSEAPPFDPRQRQERENAAEQQPSNQPIPLRRRSQRQRDAEARRHWQAPAGFFASREGAA